MALRFAFPDIEKSIRDQAQTRQLIFNNRSLTNYHWPGTGHQRVLIVHGWIGRSTQFVEIIKVLNMAGYRVHAIDFPAHSLSGGRTTNPYEMSEVLAHFIEDLGLLNAIITHYLGEPVAVLALRDPPVANKVICISAPSSGPGHRRILRDPQVIEKIRTFIPS